MTSLPSRPPAFARVLAFVSFLLLAAHFFRAGLLPGVGAALRLLPLPWLVRPWAASLAQGGLVLGSVEWVRTLLLYASQRQVDGRPVLRLVLILGSVALVTLVSALLLTQRRAAPVPAET